MARWIREERLIGRGRRSEGHPSLRTVAAVDVPRPVRGSREFRGIPIPTGSREPDSLLPQKGIL
jgi:hypothetical protein